MTSKPITILGFTGKAGNGKTTAANSLRNGYCSLEFAKPIKDAAKALYRLTDEQLYGPLKETVDPRCGKSPRQIMQEIGDHCRKQNPRFFVVHMLARINAAKHQGIRYFVIPDVRYDIEAYMIKSQEGKIIRIDRGDGFTTTRHSDHSSEAGILNSYIDFEISNDSTIGELVDKVQKIGSRIRS
jgi:hypothetical protein